jgi:hypothetical protein
MDIVAKTSEENSYILSQLIARENFIAKTETSGLAI